MTREELDFIGSMNMCDEISNEAYKKIACHCGEQEPCEDAISRQAVIDEMYKRKANGDAITAGFIKNLKPVTPQPKTGHWIEQIDHEENCRTLICSNCDRPALHDEDSIWKHKFCPHCGAKMVEPQESEEE